MEKDLFTAIASIATAVVGVAIIATLVSNKANTAGVISSAGTAYANVLTAALNPYSGTSGAGVTGNLTF